MKTRATKVESKSYFVDVNVIIKVKGVANQEFFQ